MATESPTATPAQRQTPRGPLARHQLARTLVINAIAPYVLYVLCKPYVGGFVALAMSALPPALESLWSVVRRKRIDVMAIVVLGGIALSLGLFALGGSERVLLLRESLVTSAVGLTIAASVLFRRPLLYLLAVQLAVERDPNSGARMQSRWDTDPQFRRSMRVISLVWGIGLMVEMAVRTIMVLEMDITRFLLISPFVQYGLTGLLVLWTVVHGRHLVTAPG